MSAARARLRAARACEHVSHENLRRAWTEHGRTAAEAGEWLRSMEGRWGVADVDADEEEDADEGADEDEDMDSSSQSSHVHWAGTPAIVVVAPPRKEEDRIAWMIRTTMAMLTILTLTLLRLRRRRRRSMCPEEGV